MRVHFVYDGGGTGKGGNGTLSISGKKVGEGRLEKTVPAKFTGDLKKVTVEVQEH